MMLKSGDWNRPLSFSASLAARDLNRPVLLCTEVPTLVQSKVQRRLISHFIESGASLAAMISVPMWPYMLYLGHI